MHHFITLPVIQGDLLIISEYRVVHQMRRVLRMRQGESCIIQRETMRYICEIQRYSNNDVQLHILDTIPSLISDKGERTLIVAIPQQISTAETIVQKCTEIGIDTIIRFASKRSQLRDIHSTKLSRLSSIALESSEQSHRWTIPTIKVTDWESILEIVTHHHSIIFSLNKDIEVTTKQGIIEYDICLVGPEGGWTEEEEKQLKQCGCSSRSLGQTVLRMETACILGSRRLTQQLS